MRSLRVLHFNTIYICSRTFGIEYLVSLRFLVIQNLPTWIDKLVNLEYLCVDLKWGKTVYLPPTIVKMKRLRYHSAEPANFRKDWKMKKLRNDCASYAKYSEDWNISNQTNNLEYLSQIAIKTVRDEELLKCSPHLRKLRCIYNQEGIGKREYPHFDLHFLTQLHTLFIKFSPHFYLRVAELVKFRFPANIRKLTLCSSWLPWKKMSIIGRLEFLEVLKLYEDAFVGEIWDTRDGEFQKLRYLQLDGLSYLSQWNVASNEHFPELQQLILIGCDNLAEIPSEIGEITTLELIEVRGYCLSSLVESAERIKEEQWDAGNDELKVIISDARPYVSGAPDEDEASDIEISDEDEA